MTEQQPTSEEMGFSHDHRDVLQKAASLLETEGAWMTGNWGAAYYRDEAGNPIAFDPANDKQQFANESDVREQRDSLRKRIAARLRDLFYYSTSVMADDRYDYDVWGETYGSDQVYEQAKKGVQIDRYCALGAIEAAAGQLGVDYSTLEKAREAAEAYCESEYGKEVADWNDSDAGSAKSVGEMIRGAADSI